MVGTLNVARMAKTNDARRHRREFGPAPSRSSTDRRMAMNKPRTDPAPKRPYRQNGVKIAVTTATGLALVNALPSGGLDVHASLGAVVAIALAVMAWRR